MPEAGWYQDPHNPNQQRYWDGNTWTEHTHDAPFHAPQTPNQGTGPGYGVPSQMPGYINDIGEWLGRSFSVLFANAMPLFILLVLGMIPTIVALLTIGWAVEDIVIQVGNLDADSGPSDISVDGLSGGAISLAVLVVILTPIIGALFSLAQSFILHRGHVGQSASLGDAFSAGLTGLPRYIGWVLAVGFGVLGLLLAVVLVVAVLATISAALAALAIFALVVAAIPFFVWLGVKVGFLGVSSAVAPHGQSALRASTERSTGRFWGVFGRMLLLGVITFFVYALVQGFASPSLSGAVALDNAGEPTLDGVPFDELEEIPVRDLFPVGASLVIPSIISGLLTGAVGLYSRSGLAGLYADTNGPSDLVAGSTEGPTIES
ncbi:MAG: DUF2510 domain-containing protein [Acidimicrobiia bacterium]|nr:DUF2510 domain-containing protein [Acidimicrobiia bacterium]